MCSAKIHRWGELCSCHSKISVNKEWIFAMILICSSCNVKEDKLFHHQIPLEKSEQLAFLKISIHPSVYNLASECGCKFISEADEQCFLASVRLLWHFCYSCCSRLYNRGPSATSSAVIRKCQLCSDGLGHCPEQVTEVIS